MRVLPLLLLVCVVVLVGAGRGQRRVVVSRESVASVSEDKRWWSRWCRVEQRDREDR